MGSMTPTPTISTLKKRADFLRLNRGRKFIADYFILRYAPTPTAPEQAPAASRIGYTVTTKCGNSVRRNRIRRRLRAMVREQAATIKPGMDYVLIARAGVAPDAGDAPIEALRAAIKRGFEAASR